MASLGPAGMFSRTVQGTGTAGQEWIVWGSKSSDGIGRSGGECRGSHGNAAKRNGRIGESREGMAGNGRNGRASMGADSNVWARNGRIGLLRMAMARPGMAGAHSNPWQRPGSERQERTPAHRKATSGNGRIVWARIPTDRRELERQESRGPHCGGQQWRGSAGMAGSGYHGRA